MAIEITSKDTAKDVTTRDITREGLVENRKILVDQRDAKTAEHAKEIKPYNDAIDDVDDILTQMDNF